MLNKKIKILQGSAPYLTNVSYSEDMGYEFSAVVPSGVIYAEPGMLLNYSQGAWPPDSWSDLAAADYEKLLKDFLLDEAWTVIGWEKLGDEEIDNLLEDADGFRSEGP